MTRRRLNLLTALPLLLCVAAAALWVRSYWVADTLAWRGEIARGGVRVRVRTVLQAGRGGAMGQELRLVRHARPLHVVRDTHLHNRMIRRLLNLLTLLSLLLCVAVVALWVWTYGGRGRYVALGSGRETVLSSRDGHVSLLRMEPGPAQPFVTVTHRWEIGGIGVRQWEFASGQKMRRASVPHWLLVLGASALPTAWALAALP